MRALCLSAAVAAALAAPDSADLRRAWQPHPYADSHVAGRTGSAAWKAINRHLRAGAAATRPCEEWGHAELNALSESLHGRVDARLAHAYSARGDKRALHFDGLGYKRALWGQEAQEMPAHGEAYNVSRDGKCAEAVMWHAHHLSADSRAELARDPAFVLPQMPARGPVVSSNREYIFQIQCSTCHIQGSLTGLSNPHPMPKLGNMTKCPINNETGKADVFYNRTKRCDWDFDPPCQMCESIGGYIWGDLEDQIHYTTCEPVMKAEDIPKDNVTNPVWWEYFTVAAYNVQINQQDQGGPFPGADPCDTSHKFEIQYQQYDYNGTDSKAPYTHFYQEGIFGAPPFGDHSGSNVTNNIWHLPNTQMWIQTQNPDTGKTLLAQCVGVHQNGNKSSAPLGPLRHDFAGQAVLIGREKIGVEVTPYGEVGWTSVADHWIMGPHQFWVDVKTNLMIRAWQPFNALQTFYNWKQEMPDKELFVPYPEIIAKYVNLSCPHEAPPVPPSGCSEAEYCSAQVGKCLTPTAVSCANSTAACSADQACDPITKLCAAAGKDCVSSCRGDPTFQLATSYCCPAAKHCATPTDPGTLCGGDADCAAGSVCCPLLKECVTVGPECNP